MISPRRGAQLGLAAACLTLVSSITILMAGSVDSPDSVKLETVPVATASHIIPLAAGQIDLMQENLSDQIASDK